MKTLNKIIRWPFIALITLYQKTLSPDYGWLSGFYPHGYCRYNPTCSEYTKQAIGKHGVVLGTLMGSWRILRCNPWSRGGNDPVPEKKEIFSSLFRYLPQNLQGFLSGQAFVIFALIFTAAKLLIFNSQIDIHYPLKSMILGYVLSLYVVGIIFVPIFFIKSNRKRYLVASTVALIVSIILFFDLVYYRIFSTLPTVSLFNVIGQVDQVMPSVIDLIKWSDIFLFADIIVLFYLSASKKYKKVYESGKYEIYVLVLFIIASMGVVTIFGFSNKAKERANISLNIVLENRTTSQYFGVLGYHIIDIYRSINEGLRVVPESEKKSVVEWYEGNLNLKQGKSDLWATAKNKRIILIQVESLANFVIGKSIEGQEITPNINKLVANSYLFSDTRYMIGGGHTSDTDLVINSSLYPIADAAAFAKYGKDDYVGLADVLRKAGYSTSAYHAYNRNFWNRSEALISLGYDRFLAAESYPKGVTANINGLNDKEFFEKTLDYVIDQDSNSLSYIITLTSHHPFTPVEDRNNIKITDERISEISRNYLTSINYTDRAIGLFVDGLKEAGIYDDSLIVLVGDHNPTIGDIDIDDVHYIGNSLDSKKVPLIFKTPGQSKGYFSTKTITTLDIMPTILDLSGIDGLSPMFGESVFRDGCSRCSNGEVIHTGSVDKCSDIIAIEKDYSAKLIRYNLFSQINY